MGTSKEQNTLSMGSLPVKPQPRSHLFLNQDGISRSHTAVRSESPLLLILAKISKYTTMKISIIHL